MELTKHDSRLLAATITYLLAISGSGDEGALALDTIKNKNSRRALADATELLAVAREGMELTDGATIDGETFVENLARLQEIGRGLLGADTVTAEPAVMEPIDNEGKSTGPKQYQLWLTHDEIHLIHHAIVFVTAGLEGDGTGLAKAALVFSSLAEDGYDAFVDKFNQVHEAARQDDGESSTKTDETVEEM